MREQVSFTCDVCGSQRKETNHWFKVFQRNGLDAGIGIFIWTYNNTEPHSHACSDKCVGTLVQRWLDAQKQRDAERPTYGL